MKTLAIIGSTGSIGRTSLNILKKNKKKFKLIYLSCNQNANKLENQLKKFKPLYFHINKNTNKNLKKKVNKIKTVDFFIKKKIKIDYIISGVSGFDSIDLNIKLLKVAKNLLLANKETIVCGGKIFLDIAKKNRCKIIPIDSEHYCINFFLENFKLSEKIKKIILTASGGPFLKKKPSYKENIKNVLNHPNWKMGKNISVDSSTMANKIIEMFEAKILFNLQKDAIDIAIEEKSLIHSIIVLNNNLNFFVSHKTSMEIPISNSLNLNNYVSSSQVNQLFDIKKINNTKFPLVKLGFKILKYGHAGMILFTVINQRLVNQFLDGAIFYGDICKKLINLFNKNEIVILSKKGIKTISDVKKIINFAKKIKI